MTSIRIATTGDALARARADSVSATLASGSGVSVEIVPTTGDPRACLVAGECDLVVSAIAALPVATVLTIPAAGSEASTASVITKEEGMLKRGFNSDLLYPRFSILNPELAFSLPKDQAANGIADIMSHLLERYFTNSRPVELTDRLIEATLRTVIDAAPRVMADPRDYDAWAEIMWSGTIAHNNLLNTGRVGDWATHDLEHEVSAAYGVAHGAGLAMLFPAWMRYTIKHDIPRFAQLASRVWGADASFFDQERTAREGIARLEAFWTSLGLAVRLSGRGIGAERIGEMADKASSGGTRTVGNFVKIGKAEAEAIYRLAL